MFDVAVIGAGMAGLTCAQQLQQAGYTVVVIEKSRGLGGRIATRRLQNSCADHGVRYLEHQGERSQHLIEILTSRGILHSWNGSVYELHKDGRLFPPAENHPRYVSPIGLTAVAKFLAMGLDIRHSQRVQHITPQPNRTWELTLEPSGVEPSGLTTRAVVVAIPAPQALMLLAPLAKLGLPLELLTNLQAVKFEPCLSAIATYPTEQHEKLAELHLPWQAVIFYQDPTLTWVGLESSKRLTAQQPTFVIQSSAEFAERALEATDLQPIGQEMLTYAAQRLISWLDKPEEMQVHRWRYAFPSSPWKDTHLTTTVPLPLVCTGDWCGGNNVESAICSGLAAANQVNQHLDERLILDLSSTFDRLSRF